MSTAMSQSSALETGPKHGFLLGWTVKKRAERRPFFGGRTHKVGVLPIWSLEQAAPSLQMPRSRRSCSRGELEPRGAARPGRSILGQAAAAALRACACTQEQLRNSDASRALRICKIASQGLSRLLELRRSTALTQWRLSQGLSRLLESRRKIAELEQRESTTGAENRGRGV